MNEESFTLLLKQLESASFDPQRLQIISVTVGNAHLSAAQVARVLQTFTFDPKRLEGLGLMVGHIVDPESQSQILECFTFDRDKKAAAALIRKGPNPRGAAVTPRPRVRQPEPQEPARSEPEMKPREKPAPKAMAEEPFQSLFSQFSNESFDDNKLPIIQLAAQHNWFSVAQAERLLKSMTFDEGKLKLLRLLAPRLINREQGFSLLKVFTFSDKRKKAEALLR